MIFEDSIPSPLLDPHFILAAVSSLGANQIIHLGSLSRTELVVHRCVAGQIIMAFKLACRTMRV